jgi:fatty-acyl-CoA synthase
MQSYALTVDKFLRHAAKWSGEREVVTADAGAVASRIGYAGLFARANRLSGALAHLGLGFGDRIGTLAWNTQHHLEIYYASMGAGMVCHTLNPRLAPMLA